MLEKCSKVKISTTFKIWLQFGYNLATIFEKNMYLYTVKNTILCRNSF